MKIAKLWVVSWKHTEPHAWKTEQLEDALDNYREYFLGATDASAAEWLILAVCPTYAQALSTRQALERALDLPPNPE